MKKLTALICLLVATGVQAQEQPRLYQIDFPGGTALDFQEQELDELGFNVILPATAHSITIPEISLRNVSERELFGALSVLGANSMPAFEWQPSHEQDDFFPNNLLQELQGQRVWTLVQYGHKTAKPFSVRQLLEEYSIDEITSAIEATVQAVAESQNRSSDIEFRFHEATDLLIIVGYDQDVDSAAETIEALSDY